MNNEFINRLDMFTTALNVLHKEAYKTLWYQQAPVIFTTKVGEATEMVAELRQHHMRQETDFTGQASSKAAVEAELEECAHEVGQALALFLRDQGRADQASEVDLCPSAWAKLRDQQLLQKVRLVLDRTAAAIAGPNDMRAGEYGLTTEAHTRLQGEWEEFNAMVNAPAVSIGIRKALTGGLRPAFRIVESKFEELDILILQFRRNVQGLEMLTAWKAARALRGPGSGATSAPVVTAPGA